MNARSQKKRWSKTSRRRQTMLRGLESLENRNLLAGELLEIRLEAFALDGVTSIVSVNPGQEFLIRGTAKDLRTGPEADGAFQVYTDISYTSAESTPIIYEVQRVDFTGSPTGGTFTLTYQGTTTDAIPYLPFAQGQAQAQAIQDALEGDIPALLGNVRVEQDTSFNSSLPNNRYYIRFINALDETDVTQITGNGSQLTKDPGETAGVAVTEYAKGVRSNLRAFQQAFLFNPRIDSLNEAAGFFPDNRLATDEVDLFDNAGGGAPLFDPPGQGYTPYFVLRVRAEDGGADGALIFTNDMPNEQFLTINLTNRSEPLNRNQVLFTYGGPSTEHLEVFVGNSVRATDDAYSVNEDGPAIVLSPSPLANDFQAPPTPRTLRITGVSAGSNGGTLTIINNGADVRYDSAPNFFGTETFTYTIDDGQGNTSVGDISITVNPVNDAPSFTKGANVGVNEDSPTETIPNWATAISRGPGEAGQTLTFQVTTNNDALFQTLPTISPTGTLSFTPAPNRFGQATVTVILRDNGGTANGGDNASAPQTFIITVRAVNDAPVNTVPGPRTTTGTNPVVFQGATRFSMNDVDSASGDLVTVLSVLNGTLQIGGTVPPGLIVAGNGTASVTLTGTKVEINSAISIVTYRANGGFSGDDTLTMVTNDQGNTGNGGAKSDSDTVTITVVEPPAPSAVDDLVTINEDSGPRIIDVLANDNVHFGSDATLESFSQAGAAGSVARDDGGTPADTTDDRLIFTPALNFNGQAVFTYVMNDTDGTGDDSTGTVRVTVRPVNDAPTALANSYSVAEDTLLTRAAPGVLANDSDVDGDELTAVRITSPQNGTLNFASDGSFTYQPNANFNGIDSFTYRARDPDGAVSPTRMVRINVQPRGDRPVGQDKSYATNEDQILNVPASQGLLVGASDADGDTNLRTVRLTQPSKGTATVNADGSFVYRPAANSNGQDSFTYRVVDSTSAGSFPHTVTINVAAVNDRPIARPDGGYTTSDGVNLVVPVERGVLNNDSDVDGDALVTWRADPPSHGSVTLNPNGSFTYRPAPGFVGTDTFTYRARDDAGAPNSFSAKATVTITVTETNDPPSATAKSYNASEDNDLVVNGANGLLVGASDPEGDPLTAVIVSQPSRGQLLAAAGNGAFTYRPNADANGTDTFTFKVNDGQLDSPVRTVTINVAAVNDSPPAINDQFNVIAGTANLLGDVLANDRAAPNPDGNETLTLAGFDTTSARGGTVTRNTNGQLVYTPPAGFTGSDSFNYRVSDGNGGQQSATVTLNVISAQPNTLSGFVYRDVNENGRRDANEAGIAGVKVRLIAINGPAATRTFTTNGFGRYSFGGVTPGSYRILEVQPRYLIDGAEQLGSAGGQVGSDQFVLNIPSGGLPGNQGANYNFGEGGVLVGENPNGDPPLQFTLEEILATNTNLGALIALQGSQQQWFTTLDPSWSNVEAMSIQLSNDLSRLTLTVVVNEGGLRTTYRATVLRNQGDDEALHFRVMATNNEGFQIIRLDGDLDLSEFSQVSAAASADAVFSNY